MSIKRIEDLAPDGRYIASDQPKLIPMVKPPRPKEATTMFEMSQNSVGMDNNKHAYLVGSGGTPPYPSSGIWDLDRANIERPLGELIDYVPDSTTVDGSPRGATQPECPYLSDAGCHLEINDIGPCLCRAPS